MIPRIEIPFIGIKPINTYIVSVPTVLPPSVPINVPIGFPLIEMPCVKARRNVENDALIDTDPEHNLKNRLQLAV